MKTVRCRPEDHVQKLITPKARCKRSTESETRSPAQQYAAMTWAQGLKRVFNSDIETCQHCGGAVKVIDCI